MGSSELFHQRHLEPSTALTPVLGAGAISGGDSSFLSTPRAAKPDEEKVDLVSAEIPSWERDRQSADSILFDITPWREC